VTVYVVDISTREAMRQRGIVQTVIAICPIQRYIGFAMRLPLGSARVAVDRYQIVMEREVGLGSDKPNPSVSCT
jgi:hypothetical protein